MSAESTTEIARLWDLYERATELAIQGDSDSAVSALEQLRTTATEPRLRAHVENDLGVLAIQAGNIERGRGLLTSALLHLPDWSVACENLNRIDVAKLAIGESATNELRTRIAIVSLLFNWPSTGGGTVHTAEAARFLTRAGYDVQHFSVQYDPWGIGQVREPTDWSRQDLRFSESDWRRSEIEQRLRNAVDAFAPDAVIVTDSWSMKPRLAAALAGHRVYLRLAAQECLCPLNNVRLLSIHPRPESCPRQQLATPEICQHCVATRGHFSGSLHQVERQLADFTADDYPGVVRRAFAAAAGVLVVNPLIAEMVKPFAQAVHVIPSGFDPARFPWDTYLDEPPNTDRPTTLLFAGLVDEPMKGFEVLTSACEILRSQGQRFRLVVTSDPVGPAADGIEYIGWKSQANLPQEMRAADIVVCPTIAEEALGRTAVEAMGAWRPVVASRLGGLPFTVLEEATGLLCEPGDPVDLARQLNRLIGDPALRRRLGEQGRRRFETHYTWNTIVDRHYLPLLGNPVRRTSSTAKGAG